MTVIEQQRRKRARRALRQALQHGAIYRPRGYLRRLMNKIGFLGACPDIPQLPPYEP